MKIMGANTLSDFASKTVKSTFDLAGVVRNLIPDVRDCYRPKLHDMRGPGQKWCAKHQSQRRFEAEGTAGRPGRPVASVCARSRED